jgi:hypothetical protein
MAEFSELLLTASDFIGELECSIHNQHCNNVFFIPFYLQSILVHSGNFVKSYTMARRRVLSSASV